MSESPCFLAFDVEEGASANGWRARLVPGTNSSDEPAPCNGSVAACGMRRIKAVATAAFETLRRHAACLEAVALGADWNVWAVCSLSNQEAPGSTRWRGRVRSRVNTGFFGA